LLIVLWEKSARRVTHEEGLVCVSAMMAGIEIKLELVFHPMAQDIRLPQSEVDLSAYTVPAEGPGEPYNYKWELVSQPTDSTGTMQNAASSKLSLARLSQGLYQFKVTVTGNGAQGVGFGNISVLSG